MGGEAIFASSEWLLCRMDSIFKTNISFAQVRSLEASWIVSVDLWRVEGVQDILTVAEWLHGSVPNRLSRRTFLASFRALFYCSTISQFWTVSEDGRDSEFPTLNTGREAFLIHDRLFQPYRCVEAGS